MTCLFHPVDCAVSGFWSFVGGIEWYWWALAGLILVGVIWKFAGWPGLIALAAGVGFIFGRRSAEPGHENVDDGPDAKPPFRRKPSRVKPAPSPKGKPSLIERLTGRSE